MNDELNQTIARLLASVSDYEKFRSQSSATRNAIEGLKLPPLSK
jgi:hypothetical protein